MTKIIHQQTVRPFSPLIISSYYFRPCVSYLKDQTQADSATIFTPDKPWQAAIGHYDTLCPVKTMLHTLLQMVLISLFFLLFSSFYRFLLYSIFDWIVIDYLYFITTHCALSLNFSTHCVRLYPPIDHYYFCYISNVSFFYLFIFIYNRFLFDSYHILTQCVPVKLLLRSLKSEFGILRPGRF